MNFRGRNELLNLKILATLMRDKILLRRLIGLWISGFKLLEASLICVESLIKKWLFKGYLILIEALLLFFLRMAFFFRDNLEGKIDDLGGIG